MAAAIVPGSADATVVVVIVVVVLPAPSVAAAGPAAFHDLADIAIGVVASYNKKQLLGLGSNFCLLVWPYQYFMALW